MKLVIGGVDFEELKPFVGLESQIDVMGMSKIRFIL